MRGISYQQVYTTIRTLIFCDGGMETPLHIFQPFSKFDSVNVLPCIDDDDDYDDD
jgi:hypothetical protein